MLAVVPTNPRDFSLTTPNPASAMRISLRLPLTAIGIAAAAFLITAAPSLIRNPPDLIATKHPTSENRPAASDLAALIREADVPPPGSRLSTLAAKIRGAELVGTIGNATGDPTMVFSRIGDVTVDTAGNIYVLDIGVNEVRVFDFSHTLRLILGTAADSAGKLTASESIELWGNGGVAVAERTNAIKYFETSRASSHFDSVTYLPYEPLGICAMDGEMFVRSRSRSASPIIHVYKDHQPVRSFGRGYKTSNALVEWDLTDGLISCDPAADVILSASRLLPYVSAYSPEGKDLWTITFPDLLPSQIVERGNSVTVSRDPDVGSHQALQMVSLGNGYTVIQFMHRKGAGSEESSYRIDSYLVESATGHGIFIGRTTPWLMAASGQTLYAFQYRPFPRLEIYQLSGLN